MPDSSEARQPLTKAREKELRQQADPKRNPSAGYVGAWLRDLLGEIDRIRAAYGLLSLEADALRRGNSALDAEVQALRRVLRRKAVLDNYGLTIQNIQERDFEEWLAIVSSDEKLVEWYGDLPSYIEDELAAIDLLAGARSTAREADAAAGQREERA